jgi:hypothetical protein
MLNGDFIFAHAQSQRRQQTADINSEKNQTQAELTLKSIQRLRNNLNN